MSWDVYLEHPETGETLPVSDHEEGGTYMVGGNPRAELNVTYNYGIMFRLAAKGVGWEVLTNLSNMGTDLKPFDLMIQADQWNENALGALELKTASQTTDFLERLIGQLNPSGTKDGPDDRCDYWVPAPRNAAHALSILLTWAREHPDGVWRVT